MINTIQVTKNSDGFWQCETDIDFDDDRILKISTSKLKSGIITTLTVGIAESAFSFSTMRFHDFSKIIRHTKFTRATAENIRQLHNEVLADKESHITEAKKHYESLARD